MRRCKNKSIPKKALAELQAIYDKYGINLVKDSCETSCSGFIGYQISITTDKFDQLLADSWWSDGDQTWSAR